VRSTRLSVPHKDDYQLMALHSDTLSEILIIACVKVSSLHTRIGKYEYIHGRIEENGLDEDDAYQKGVH
jgi:hypothetical protein